MWIGLLASMIGCSGDEPTKAGADSTPSTPGTTDTSSTKSTTTPTADTGMPPREPFVGNEVGRVTFGAEVRSAQLAGLSTGELAIAFAEGMPADPSDTTLYLSIFSPTGDLLLPRKVVTEDDVNSFALSPRPDGTVALVYSTNLGAWHEIYDVGGIRQGLRIVLHNSITNNLGLLAEADRSVVVSNQLEASRFQILDPSTQSFEAEGALSWTGQAKRNPDHNAHLVPLAADRYLVLASTDTSEALQTQIHGDVLAGGKATRVGNFTLTESFGVPDVAQFGSGEAGLFFSSVGDFNLYVLRFEDGAEVGPPVQIEERNSAPPRIVATRVEGGDVLVMYESLTDRGQYRRVADGTFTVSAPIEFTDEPASLLDATTLVGGATAIAYTVGSTSINAEALLLR